MLAFSLRHIDYHTLLAEVCCHTLLAEAYYHIRTVVVDLLRMRVVAEAAVAHRDYHLAESMGSQRLDCIGLHLDHKGLLGCSRRRRRLIRSLHHRWIRSLRSSVVSRLKVSILCTPRRVQGDGAACGHSSEARLHVKACVCFMMTCGLYLRT